MKQWYRIEMYASGRRVKNTIHPCFYLTEEEVLKLAWGICIGMRVKYKVPKVEIYDTDNNLIKTCY